MADGEWMRLEHLSCPVKNCPNTKTAAWVCSKDGNNTYLNEYGHIKCAHRYDSRAIHIGNLCAWGWKCGYEHKGADDKADIGSFTFAMSDALKFGGNNRGGG